MKFGMEVLQGWPVMRPSSGQTCARRAARRAARRGGFLAKNLFFLIFFAHIIFFPSTFFFLQLKISPWTLIFFDFFKLRIFNTNII